MKVVLRQMELEDLDCVLEIEKESFSIPWTRNSFILEISKNALAQYIVAELDNRVVGYVGVWLIHDEGHVTNIAVRKDCRRKGIGKFLMLALIEFCKKSNIERITLEVRKSNIIAQNLYKKYGFYDCGIRPKYYDDNHEDAVIMWKIIER